MAYLFVLLTILTFLIVYRVSYDSKHNSLTFRAAVYEYQRFSNSSVDRSEVKLINLRSYGKAIQTASYLGADIIVFPESGLFSSRDRLNASLTYEYIPLASEIITPCSDWDQFSNVSTSSPSIYSLSCLARGFKIYVAAILGEKVECSSDPDCPDDGFFFYNTQVLFDSSGKLIAKYHKYHLFFEPAHNIPKEPEIVTVSTPFGKLGFLICFDINFEHPALDLVYRESVDTLLFGAHWTDELPFLNAHVVQSGFSIEHNVNLLAAGINDLNNGALGSGIYAAGEGHIIYTADISKGSSKLLIADIPKSARGLNSRDIRGSESPFVKMIIKEEKEKSTYIPWTLELDLFNHTRLSHQSGNLTSCSENVCCQLDYSASEPIFTDDYYLLVKRWIRPTTKICEQFCGLVAYSNSGYVYTSSVHFDYLRLTGTFTSNLSIPSVVTNYLQLVSKSEWNYVQKSNVATISFHRLGQPLIRATLYSRCEKDDEQSSI